MQNVTSLILTIFAILFLPPLALGTIRKVKARLQNRIGAPILQPLFDLVKLSRKDETLSSTASCIFRFAAVFNCAAGVFLALSVPWVGESVAWDAGMDIFAVIYLLAAMRLFTLLAAMDTGSSFGAFAASREATLSFLVEPVSMLSLLSLSMVAHSTKLGTIFSYTHTHSSYPVLWLLSGTALLLASLVELSRMPIDDPTTHLELTMVHEAMVLEYSGKNLALVEYSNALKLSLLFGLTAQCFLHSIVSIRLDPVVYGILSVFALLAVCLAVGVFESIAVKLNWRKAPEFIAYGITLAVVGSMLAVGVVGL